MIGSASFPSRTAAARPRIAVRRAACTHTQGRRFRNRGQNRQVAVIAWLRASSRTSHEDPFGNTIRLTGTGTIAKDNPFRFSTKRTEDITDLVLYEYRPYSPSLGRWPNRDPIFEESGLNLYGFLGNSPVHRYDAQGLLAKEVASCLCRAGAASLTAAEAGSAGGPIGAAILATSAYAGAVLGADLALALQLSALNDENAQAEEANKIAEQQLTERKAYHKICDQPTPPNLKNPRTLAEWCAYWRWVVQREKECVRARQGYIDKWNDTYEGHVNQINQRNRTIQTLEEKIKNQCDPCGL